MKKIRIATYNIWHAGRVKEDVGAIGRALSDMGADIIGLQEVDIGTDRMRGMDTLALIAAGGGYPYYTFVKSMDYAGGVYGTAIVSRYPIVSAETVALFSGDLEPRAFGNAVIDVDGTQLRFLNTHLTVEDREMRVRQFKQLLAATGAYEDFILTGDFNTEDLSELAILTNAQTVNPKRFQSYYPGATAIDHIFLTKGYSYTDAQMPQLELSDHYPVWADVVIG